MSRSPLPPIAAMILILLAGGGLAGCGAVDLMPARDRGPYLAREAGWNWELIDAGAFVLATAQSPSMGSGGRLTVYIEGDGMAFTGSRTISPDPTPERPVGLRLALRHPGPAAYIARPCQYTMEVAPRGCRPAYWTSGRYAETVISSLGLAIDAMKRRSGAGSLVLIGYSGGGAAAALLAARRTDVSGFVTVGANLDLGYWTARDHLAPLSGSLDPADAAAALRTVPQVHFIGGRDEVVTPDVVASYRDRLGPAAALRVVELPEFTHSCCWIDAWPDLLRRREFAVIPGWGG